MADSTGPFDEVTAADLVNELNESDEHHRIEAKRGRDVGKSLLETICAYANEPRLRGGYILVGVSRSEENELWRQYRAESLSDPDKLQADIASQCRVVFNRPIRPRIKVDRIGDAVVLVVWIDEVAPSEKPIFLRSAGLPAGAFRRIASADHHCTEEDLLVFAKDQAEGTHDESIVHDSSMDDIDESAVALYRQIRGRINPNAEELLLDDQGMLVAIGCCRHIDRTPKPTVAGIILFGTRGALRRLFPMMRIDYIRMSGTRWVQEPADGLEAIEIRDPLLRAIPRARAAILDDLPKALNLPTRELERQDVPAIPSEVVREAVVNAVMHRSYRDHGPIQIIRYSNRLEIRNPGFSLVSPEDLGHPGSAQRNPKIGAVLHDLHLAETKGLGIGMMRREMQAAHLSPPYFDSDRRRNQFTAFLLFHHFLSRTDIQWLAQFSGLGDDDARAMIFVREMGAIDNSAYRSLNGVETLTASARLRRLRDAEFLQMKGKGAETYYVPGLRFRDVIEVDPHEATSAGSGTKPTGSGTKPTGSGTKPTGSGTKPTESGTRPTGSGTVSIEPLPDYLAHAVAALGRKPSRTTMHRTLLNLCSWKELRAKELAVYLSRNQDYLRYKYISPLLDEGLLTVTANPSDPGVAYAITEPGIRWLEDHH